MLGPHFPTDPDENAASLLNAREILFPCLEAAGVRSVVEVGAFHGKSTRALLDWAASSGARIVAIEPAPAADLRELSRDHPELDLVEAPSEEALARIDRCDAVLLDGDHNHYTLSRELELIEERSPGAELPLLVLHDIGWPLARRDAYYAPERIPQECRQPLARNVFLEPGNPGVSEGGLPFECVAAREGGPRNGTMTAIEDFMRERPELELAIVPAFFGVGVLWHGGSPWAAAVAGVVAPWDRNPLLARLEENRVLHMVERYRLARELDLMVEWSERQAEREHLLRAMLGSRAFAWAERLSALRRGEPVFTREQVRRALGEGNGRA